MRVLGPYFDGLDPDFSDLRSRAKAVLQTEGSLSEVVQLVGRDSLSEDQKVRCALCAAFACVVLTCVWGVCVAVCVCAVGCDSAGIAGVGRCQDHP